VTYYVLCAVETMPCPDVSQALAAAPTLADFEALGITGASLSTSVALGAAIIFAVALIALSAGALIKLIRQT
jgi:hypothetical protein